MLLLILPYKLNFLSIKKRFTLHFATINTSCGKKVYNVLPEFTLHFATINTKQREWGKIQTDKFTLHFATINTT